jgi:glycosyltransferase involved in cell wall biosynthesis
VLSTEANPSFQPPPIGARTAIVHDWFQGFHGAERVVEAMRDGLFEAGAAPDIFTFQAARDLLPEALADRIVQESRLARLPLIRQQGHDPGRWRYLLPYMPYYFRRLDLDEYDVVISSSHACAAHVRPRPDALHVCYCYTPMRYAWLPRTDGQRVTGVRGVALGALTNHLRRLDLRASERPDLYIAISTAVAERIRRFYGRDALVVHPPVEVDEFNASRAKEAGRFVWAHRLVAYKHPLLVAEAFRGLPYRLTMVGVGPLEAAVRQNLPPNVELLGWLSREELARVYEGASGFIHIGEEDFGITMVEALAAGTPVIALDRGGSRDIVRHGIDGILIDRPDVETLRRAIRELAETRFEPAGLAARASQFSREAFIVKLRDAFAQLRT